MTRTYSISKHCCKAIHKSLVDTPDTVLDNDEYTCCTSGLVLISYLSSESEMPYYSVPADGFFLIILPLSRDRYAPLNLFRSCRLPPRSRTSLSKVCAV